MPRSKHRRKAGGKSVKRPGLARVLRPLLDTPAMAAYKRFKARYCGPFHRQWPDGQYGAGYMLDIIADVIFDNDAIALCATNKQAAFRTFLEPFEDDFENPHLIDPTPKGAEAALAILVEQNMVIVDGDAISIHPRFADVLNPAALPIDANEDQ